jgi:YVTN family beta-propeller protein
MKAFLSAAALIVLTLAVSSQIEGPRLVGPDSRGGVRLVTSATLRPAGRQIPLDTFPMSSALSPDGRFLLVLNGGYNPPSISVIDTRSEKELGRVRLDDAWLGLAFAPNGRNVYVGGGSSATVYELELSPSGELKLSRTFPVVPAEARKHTDFIGDIALTPDGRLIYAADLFNNQVAVINPQSGRVIERFRTGRRPYRILFHPDGKSYFVTSWADAALYHHETINGNLLTSVRLGPHTTDMIWREKKASQATPAAKRDPDSDETPAEDPWHGRLYITASNTNRVYVVGVSPSKDLRLIETINVSLYPNQPAGMTPSALALSNSGNELYVVCSDANAASVVDISGPRSHVTGFIPTAWYPTAARALADGRLIVLNGRGPRSFPNPQGPNPTRQAARTHEGIRSDQYVASIQKGSASIIDPLTPGALAAYTATVFANTPFQDRDLAEFHSQGRNPIPSRPGETSPIEHVLYIVKENRTYDQVLGALGKGNGDPSLVLFGEDVTPNHHKLAREFVLLDNFYVNSDVSADGHNWSTAAIAPDYVQKMWPNSYAGRRRHYDYEGGEPAATPPAGYLWTQVLSRGLSMRNYGYQVDNIPKTAPEGKQISSVRDPALVAVTNFDFRGFDMDYTDVNRAKVFLRDLDQFEAEGKMPRFMVLRLGNDHTSGTSAGKISPRSAVADNDLALGQIVERLSKSKFWPKLAIFILEDDAQNGPDHVDSHRSLAFVISPYVRRGSIDSTLYNTTSMLRTMELILGLNPMTMFDAGATPMAGCFQMTPDTRPYAASPPRISLEERNPVNNATAARSARLNFTEADMIDDDELNDILWLALRGTEPPPPVRSFFAR